MTTLRTRSWASISKQREWSYDVITDSYRHISGVTVDRIDIDRNNGDLETVLDNALKMASVGATGAAGAVGAPYNPSIVYNGESFDDYVSSGSAITATIQNNQSNNLTIQTGLGDIAINLTTGYMSIPPGVGRADAIREFWLGFQKHFQPLDKKSYEDKIQKLEKELAMTKSSAALMQIENQKEANKRVAEKVAKKYGNEKFIMVKPEVLIKFIEED
jgi:hypothetical protein